MIDPSGLLETEQVFFQCSQGLPALDGTETNILTGDVLITRDPCRLPTDVQKVNPPCTISRETEERPCSVESSRHS